MKTLRQASLPNLLLAALTLLAAGCTETPAIDETPSAGPSGDWAQWRGPDRDGTSPSTGLLRRWQRGEPKEIWRRPLGEGFAGIAVAGGRVFTLFAEAGVEYLIALDGRDGNELWSLALGTTLSDSHGNGPRTTPTVDGGTIYALGSHKMAAADAADGRLLWQLDLAPPPRWGYSSSPLIVDELVVVHARLTGEVATGTAVMALDKRTGELAWAAEPGHPGYASPLLVALGGERQIVSFLAAGLVALRPHDGERLWMHRWSTSYSVNAADPVFIPPDRFFISSGYDTGAGVIRVVRDAERYDVEELWRGRQMRNHFSSSVLAGELIVGFDNSSLKAISHTDGAERWRQRGFGKGSLLAADSNLMVLGEDGTLALVAATGEEYRELGRVRALDEGSWAPPALAGAWLYLRDHREIVCLNLADRDAG